MKRKLSAKNLILPGITILFAVAILNQPLARAASLVLPSGGMLESSLHLIPQPLFVAIALLLLIPSLFQLSKLPLNYISIPLSFLALFSISGLEINFPRNPPEGAQTYGIVTWNAGQREGHDVTPFVYQNRPNFISIQGNSSFSLENLNSLPSYQKHSSGEYTLYSEYEVLKSKDLIFEDNKGKTYHYGVQYLIDLSSGDSMLLYNIHLPTLRDAWSQLRYRLTEALKHINPKESVAAISNAANEFSFHREISNHFLKVLENQEFQFIISGDFNCAPNSYLNRKLNKTTKDVFDSSGKGFGYTFPGKTNWKILGYDSFSRIDFIKASPNLRPIVSFTESKSLAQHKALFCKFYVKN
ncbi:MAG: hypothetical protein MI748_18000 [Opitutales bacterium]|nr:hypothetical protein [Opitutales bacterium]